MKSELRKLIFACMLIVGAVTISAQLSQHGILLNGGIGSVRNGYGSYYFHNRYYNYGVGEYDDMFIMTNFEYHSGFSAGYRLRFKMPAPKSFHYDLDLNVGAKVLNYKYDYGRIVDKGDHFTHEITSSSTSNEPHYFSSVGGTVNYSTSKNFSLGLGIEPSFYLNKASKSRYDVPVVAKVAYNFRAFEVAITGKHGLTRVFESGYLNSGRVREVQMSVFIPLKTK
jgi:hypothetical protein